LFKGSRELDEENSESFGFDTPCIDDLLLTHGHLDHCERVPLRAYCGLRDEIVVTPAARELARPVRLGCKRN
jgi:metallo-beta-lactamase family protein